MPNRIPPRAQGRHGVFTCFLSASALVLCLFLAVSCATSRGEGAVDVQARPGEFSGIADAEPVSNAEPEPALGEATIEPVPTAVAVSEPAPGPIKPWGHGAYFSVSRVKNQEFRNLWIGRIKALGLDRIVLTDVELYFRNSRRVIDFIGELKAAVPGISVGIAGDEVSFFRQAAALPALFALVDTLHYRLEFWNPAKYDYATREEAFVRSLSDLSALRVLAADGTMAVEMYLDSFTADEAARLLPQVDRVLLAASDPDSGSLFERTKDRLSYLATAADVRILVSAENRYSAPDLMAMGLRSFEEAFLLSFRENAVVTGISWNSAESLADLAIIK